MKRKDNRELGSVLEKGAHWPTPRRLATTEDTSGDAALSQLVSKYQHNTRGEVRTHVCTAASVGAKAVVVPCT
ncbi:hypothetical protein M8818_005544 [Zalaria obscura]|uniref:Uncharacterized protein n=1 Tax=Zalaria obscura TaxID=2024903 RepID=A0ACC3S893_9PEZI